MYHQSCPLYIYLLILTWFCGRAKQGHLPPLIPSVPVLLPPPEESVAMLVSMGFDRNRAVQALTEARNDVTRATNLLVEGQA